MKIKNEAIQIATIARQWQIEYLPGVRGFSPATQKTYVISLKSFIQFLEKEKNIDCTSFSGESFLPENIQAWLLDMKKRKCSNSTCNNRLAAIRNFLFYLKDKGDGLRFQKVYLKACEVKQMKTEKAHNIEISKEAIDSIFKAIDTHENIGKRDFALFFLMYSIAGRINEILSLKVSDLHMNEPNSRNYLIILGKGYKRRTPPILKDVAKILKGYISHFHGKSPNPDDFLFFSVHDGCKTKLTQEAVNARLSKYVSIAHEKNPCVPVHLSCHKLRHARASHWLEENLNIVAIQRLMGHADINTTMRYLFVSTKQKNDALSKLEDDITKKVAKKWKNGKALQSISELFDI